MEEIDGERIGKLVGMLRRDEFKGMGLCNDLLRRRIAICKALQCVKAYSAVYYKRKGLIKLYLAHGFKEIPALSDEYRRFEKEIDGD